MLGVCPGEVSVAPTVGSGKAGQTWGTAAAVRRLKRAVGTVSQLQTRLPSRWKAVGDESG